MLIQENNVRAEVYNVNEKQVYYIKVRLIDIGLFISGITARKSIKEPDGPLWVLMPQYKSAGGKYKNYIEWDSFDNRLKLLIENRARSAVEVYKRDLDKGLP